MRPAILVFSLAVALACSSTTKSDDAGGSGGDSATSNPDAGRPPSSGGHNLVASPSTVSLCSFDVGKTTAASTTTVTNTDTTDSITVMVNASAGLTVTGCSAPLAAGAACTLSITATPTAADFVAGSVSITADPGPSNTLTIGVSCASTGGPARFTMSPTVLDFGDIPIGTFAPPQAITLTTSATLAGLAVASSGEDVSIATSATTCTTTLEAGDSCLVVVNFTALAFGRKNSDAIAFSTGGVTRTVPVIANVPSPAALAIDPNAPASMSINYGETGPTVPFTVVNSGGLATGVLSVALAGPDVADFRITNNTCFIVAPLATCTFSVVFEPSMPSAAARTATLTVTDTGANAFSLSVPLSATVLTPSYVAITPSTANLGTVPVGATGGAIVFTVVNTKVDPSTVTVSLSNSEFKLASDTCTGKTLAPGDAHCTFAVAFAPTTVGVKLTTLTVDATGTSPAVGTLVGVGVYGP